MSKVRNHEEVRKDFESAVAEHQALQAKNASRDALWEAHQKVKSFMDELSASIAHGAEPCPDCGNMPRGLRHTHVVPAKNLKVFTYEVGCVVCTDHRSMAPSTEEAVELWNRGVYLPPKA